MIEKARLKRVMPRRNWNSKEEYLLYLRSFAAYESVVKLAANKVLLEIGCGAGYGVDYLSKYTTSIVSVDVDKQAVAYCQAKYGKTDLTFLLADGIKLPFKCESFDIVLSFQVIEHIEPVNVIVYLSEVGRVLKNGGVFLVSTPNKKLRLLPFQGPWNTEHRKEYSDKEFRKFLSKVFKKTKVYGLCASEDALSIERNRVKQKPLNVYAIRPCHRLFYQLYQRLNRLSSPIVHNQLERIRDIGNTWFKIKTKAKISRFEPQESFLDKFSIADFTLDPACPGDCLDLVGICTKQ